MRLNTQNAWIGAGVALLFGAYLAVLDCNPAHAHDDPPCYELGSGPTGYHHCGERKIVQEDPAELAPEGTEVVEVRIETMENFGEVPTNSPLRTYSLEDAAPIIVYCQPSTFVRIVWRFLGAQEVPLPGYEDFAQGAWATCN